MKPTYEDLERELAEMRKELNGADQLRERMSFLLTGVADALKGDPSQIGPHGGRHDWSDLPELAVETRKALEEVDRALIDYAADDECILTPDVDVRYYPDEYTARPHAGCKWCVAQAALAREEKRQQTPEVKG